MMMLAMSGALLAVDIVEVVVCIIDIVEQCRIEGGMAGTIDGTSPAGMRDTVREAEEL